MATTRLIPMHKIENQSVAYTVHELKEASEKWGMTPRWINYNCAAGRIPGTIKMATIWLIPKDAEKPIDSRAKQRKGTEIWIF